MVWSGCLGGQVAGVVKVIRVVRVRVILSEILKWQRFLEVISRFLEVISRFLEVISRFLEVISWFLEVISTRGRYRAARAAKRYFYVTSVTRPTGQV